MSSEQIKCWECFKLCDKSKAFIKSVNNLKLFPDKYQQKYFCSTNCIKKYVKDNEKKEEKSKEVMIYNWNLGQTGY